MSRPFLFGRQGLITQTHQARNRQAGQWAVRVGCGPSHSPTRDAAEPSEGRSPAWLQRPAGCAGGGEQEARMQVRGLWALGAPGQKASGPVHCPQRTQSGRSFRSGQLRAPGVSGRQVRAAARFLSLVEREDACVHTRVVAVGCGAGLRSVTCGFSFIRR